MGLDRRSKLRNDLLNAGCSTTEANIIAIDAGGSQTIVDIDYLQSLGLSGAILERSAEFVQDFYLEELGLKLMTVANSCNFFEISKEGNSVRFWGADIPPVEIEVDSRIKHLIEYFDLPYDEAVEIFDDDTADFYKEVYETRNM